MPLNVEVSNAYMRSMRREFNRTTIAVSLQIYTSILYQKDIIKTVLGAEALNRAKVDVTKSYILSRVTELRCEERRRV